MSVQIVSTGYTPRPLQALIHKSLKRFNVLLCHRRFGKTILGLNEMLDQALRNKNKRPQYAYIAPTFGQAKKVAWENLRQFAGGIPGVQFHETELRCTIPRPATGDEIVIYLFGAENYDAIRGMYLDGVILDEYADMHPDVWGKVVRPLLVDRNGWAIFIGTPKGSNHFYDMYVKARDNADWYAGIFKASETGVISDEELEAARSEMSESEYEQEFECSFAAALTGAYYGKEMEKLERTGKIMSVPYDPILPVTTAWDLGIDDSMVIWFVQQYGREIRVIDYIENSGTGLDWYVGELKARGYNYHEHLLPHDVQVRELTSGRSRLESLKKMGLRNIRTVAKIPVVDGINAVRLVLPKCVFDKDACLRGVDALKNYERKWDSKNKIFQQTPNHNWASHGADAFRTLAVGLREEAPNERDARRLPRQTESDFQLV